MRPLRPLIAAAALACCAVAFSATDVKTKLPGDGTESVAIMKSDPTAAGTFDGTWMYVNHDARFAMWIRTKDGKPQVRIQFQSLASPEAFETDWDGKSVYYMAGKAITFDLKLTRTDPARLTGSWSWIAQLDNAARKETADVSIYRTGYGHTLNMDFDNYAMAITRGGVSKTMRVPTTWSWTKVSKREILWQEMPF
jgi:predicted small secreted protein